MNDEKLMKILSVIHKYVNKYSNVEVIDYYELFGLNKKASLEDINKEIRQLKKLFNSKQIGLIPDYAKSYFEDVIEVFIGCEKVFTDEASKKAYQSTLTKYNKDCLKKKQVARKKKVQADFQKQSVKNKKEDTNDITAIKIQSDDLKALRDSVMETLKKHDLGFVMGSLTCLLENGDWTSNFSRSKRNKLVQLGQEKASEILRFFSDPNEKDLTVICLNYFGYLYREDEEFSNLFAPLINICGATYQKYGLAKTDSAFREYVFNGNPTAFTNDGMARTDLMLIFKPENASWAPYVYLSALGNAKDFINSDPKVVIRRFVKDCKNDVHYQQR